MIDSAEEARRISEIAMEAILKEQLDFAHEYIHIAAGEGKFDAHLNNDFWKNVARRATVKIQMNALQKRALEELEKEGFHLDFYYYEYDSYVNSYTTVSW